MTTHPITSLIPAPYNPRKIDDMEMMKLRRSIETFGFVEPVVVNKDMTIIGGHQRVKAAQAMGMTEVPCVMVDLPKDKEKALNLALNKISGEWDEAKLVELLKQLDDAGRVLSGFDEREIEKALRVAIEGQEDGYDTTPPKEAVTQAGDMYRLGDHVLLCGDSTKREDVERLMGGKNAIMVFTDPPYNIAYEGGMNSSGQNTREGILNDKMSPEDFLSFLSKVCANLVEFCDGGIYICMSSSEIPNLRSAFARGGGHYQSLIVWVKNTFTLSRCDWQNQHEPILYGWPARVKNHYFAGFRDQGNTWSNLDVLKPSVEDGKTVIRIGDVHLILDGIVTGQVKDRRNQTDIWHEKKPSKSTEHPTMKPVKLAGKAVDASSRPGEAVLDLFGGSGTTLIACEQMGRKCRMMELDPKYCDVIVARWEKLTGKKAELVKP